MIDGRPKLYNSPGLNVEIWDRRFFYGSLFAKTGQSLRQVFIHNLYYDKIFFKS